MKYTLIIEIEAPLETVIALFDDPASWSKWREGYVGHEAMSGTPGEQGSQTKLRNKFGSSEMEIVETVEFKDLPRAMTCTYEAPGKWMGAWNRVTNRFSESAASRTRWEFESEFRCRGFLRVMSMLVPGMFRHASLKEMTNFKLFAEAHAQGS